MHIRTKKKYVSGISNLDRDSNLWTPNPYPLPPSMPNRDLSWTKRHWECHFSSQRPLKLWFRHYYHWFKLFLQAILSRLYYPKNYGFVTYNSHSLLFKMPLLPTPAHRGTVFNGINNRPNAPENCVFNIDRFRLYFISHPFHPHFWGARRWYRLLKNTDLTLTMVHFDYFYISTQSTTVPCRATGIFPTKLSFPVLSSLQSVE